MQAPPQGTGKGKDTFLLGLDVALAESTGNRQVEFQASWEDWNSGLYDSQTTPVGGGCFERLVRRSSKVNTSSNSSNVLRVKF